MLMHKRNPQVARPPWVRGLPVLGNTHQLLRDPAGFFPDTYQRYGPIFRLQVAGTRYTVLAGREAFDFFMQTGEQHFSRAVFYQRFGREMGTDRFILGQPADAWTDLRRKLRLGLSRQVSSSHIPNMVAAVDRALDAVPEGETVAAMDLMAAISFEQYGYLLCNRSITDALPDARRYTQFIMNVGTKLWPPVTLQYPPYQRSRRDVFRYVWDLVAERRAQEHNAAESYTLLDALLSATTDNGQPVPESEVVACALYGFVGTLVYCDRAASFLLYHLLTDPELQASATREADAAFASDSTDVRALRGMHTLRAAFRESLRYHPIALGLPFRADEDFDFHGYRVREGEYVVLSLAPAHFSESLHRCPFSFDPGRFRAPRNAHRQPGAYAPFGVGSRYCPAAGLVELMTLCTVGRMLHRRQFALEPPRYRLRERLNPLPGPSRRFRLRLLGSRAPERPPAEAKVRMDDEALASALPEEATHELEGLIARAAVREHAPGETIIREGERAETFYVISEGTVEVARGSGTDRHRLAVLEPGDHFGEIGLLQEGVRTATCIAAGDGPVRLLAITRGDFRQMVESSDLVSDEIAAIARRRFINSRLQQAIPAMDVNRLPALIDQARVEHLDPGETVIRQGDPADTFHVLLRGRVEVISEGAGNEEMRLAELEPGQFFGEIGILRGEPRTSTVRVLDGEPCELLVIGRQAFLDLVEESPAAHGDIAAVMCERLLERLAEPGGDDG